MDVVEALLEGPRARSAFVLRATLEPPWSLRVQDRAPLTVFAIARGEARLRHPTGELGTVLDTMLNEGDIAVVAGPEPYEVTDLAGTDPTILINPGNDCVSLSGESVAESMSFGVRSWGNDPDGSTVMLVGTYEHAGQAGVRLLAALPTVIVARRGPNRSPLVDVLADQIVTDAPGQGVVLDRLLDLVLIDTVRRWLDANRDRAPAWYRALDDPVVGPALANLHADPADDWTVAKLASSVGVSRAALARRFTDAVDESPMAYLTRWRLSLAADLLADPDNAVGTVAREVGYRSPFTFSTAFKRHYGVSPTHYRAA